MVAGADDLAVETDFAHPAVAALDLATLVASDWVAYRFVEENRELFDLPAGARFEVRPRLDVTKTTYHRDGERRQVRECLLKVAWPRLEPNPPDRRLPARREITVGATLAIDWATRRVRALLVSEAAAAPADEPAPAAKDRSAMLLDLVERNVLRLGEEDGAPEGARAEVAGDVLRVSGSGRMLHAAALDEPAASAPAARPASHPAPGTAPARVTPRPPPGVDAGAFYDLVARRDRKLNLFRAASAAGGRSADDITD